MSQAGAFPFIVRLNRVDCLTLSSVVTTALATAMTLDQHFHLAMALLFVAMGCDGLDGLLARKWGLARNFGRYLDGFMDVLIYLAKGKTNAEISAPASAPVLSSTRSAGWKARKGTNDW